MRSRDRWCVGIVLLAGPVAADPPRLDPGAVEIGTAGSLVTTDGATRLTLALRTGSFVGIGPGLLGYEAEVSYGRIRELDRLDLTAQPAWNFPIERSSAVPFVGLVVGFRQEWLGSFSNAAATLGGVAGIRILASTKVAFRVEYRPLRFLDDPGPDFTEHQVLFGISLLLRNHHI